MTNYIPLFSEDIITNPCPKHYAALVCCKRKIPPEQDISSTMLDAVMVIQWKFE